MGWINRKWSGQRNGWMAGLVGGDQWQACQRVEISGNNSSWRLVTINSEWSILGTVLFSPSLMTWMMEKVCMWHRTVWSGCCTGGLCCHPEGPEQSGGLGCQEPHDVQWGEILNPACGEEQYQAPGHAGNHPAGKQFCRHPGRNQVEKCSNVPV